MMGPDFCEMVINDIQVNESVANAKEVTLRDWLQMMVEKRPLIFDVVLRSSPDVRIEYS